MRIGIGIDTGGTCTDGVVYDMEGKKILAAAKTPTTKENLSVGIGKALDLLPKELVKKAEMAALSTTLATNACVEGKGGRGKLIFLGMERKTVEELGKAYGLPIDDTLIFIPCQETLQGKVLKEPDWKQVKALLERELLECQAVGIVELFAGPTGAVLEKKTRQIVEELGIPSVCGYELFQEKNVIGRGAGALLNARLIFVIGEFLRAVKSSLQERGLQIPIVIVRSDGSVMDEEFSLRRPIETLLCGPVASVMGAAELHQVTDGVVIDMGGTTTDISLVRNGAPIRSEGGITVGDWRLYVKGMYVDTFGLGGDSEVILHPDGNLELGSRRIMPMAMAALRYPNIRIFCRRGREAPVKSNSWRNHIYVGLKEIGGSSSYSSLELRIAAAFYQNPMSLAALEEEYHITLAPMQLKRLVDEGVLIRCGITPTDAMHVLGDYNGYDTQAAWDAMSVMAQLQGTDEKTLSRCIYEKVQRKLYCGVARVLLWDKFPKLKQEGKNQGIEYLVEQLYEEALKQEQEGFLRLKLSCPVPLIGVGGPVGVFLKDVAKLLGTQALLGEHSNVANALGAIVGNVEVCVTLELLPEGVGEDVRVSGNGISFLAGSLEEARMQAAREAQRLARAEALRRGANEGKLTFHTTSRMTEASTNYGGSVFLSEKISVYAKSPWAGL